MGDNEARIVDLVKRGLTDLEIARELHLSVQTVARHVDLLCDQVGARNRAALAAWIGWHERRHPSPAARGRAR